MSSRIVRIVANAVSPAAAALALALAVALSLPQLAIAQTSPFLTGATALETNILAWLTPIAIILVMVLGGMAMANRVAQVSSTYGRGEAQTIVENCGNSFILRCSASEQGGTSQFASRLIGQREVVQVSRSKSRSPSHFLPSITESEHRHIEPAVMDSEIERLPDLAGSLKLASRPDWLRVTLRLPERTREAPRARGFADSAKIQASQTSVQVNHERDGSIGCDEACEHD